MRIVQGNGVNYEVRGIHEEEAAVTLAEGLTQVSKRRNAYVDSNLDVVINDIRSGYGVEVRTVLQSAGPQFDYHMRPVKRRAHFLSAHGRKKAVRHLPDGF